MSVNGGKCELLEMITYRAEASPQKKPEVLDVRSLASKGWQIVLTDDNTTNLTSLKPYTIGGE